MRVFSTKAFQKWQKKEKISNDLLLSAVEEMRRGLIDAELGSGLVKKRIARPGSGKREGYRTLLATNKGNRWFFIYGFAKTDRSNISQQEEIALKDYAQLLLSLSANDLETLKESRELKELYHA